METDAIETSVRDELSGIIDPETGLSIMRMELIHDIQVTEDGAVSMVFRPSSPVCPMAYSLANTIKQRLEALSPVRSVKITVENFERAAHLESLLESLSTTARRKTD